MWSGQKIYLRHSLKITGYLKSCINLQIWVIEARIIEQNMLKFIWTYEVKIINQHKLSVQLATAVNFVNYYFNLSSTKHGYNCLSWKALTIHSLWNLYIPLVRSKINQKQWVIRREMAIKV